MNNNLLQIKIKQRLNKLASLDYDNIECWQVQEAFNKAQIEWVRRQLHGLNSKKEAAEQSVNTIDDLQVLLSSVPLSSEKKSKYYETVVIPSDYLHFIRVSGLAKTDCCPSVDLSIYQVEEANVDILLSDEFKSPSFEWAETFCTVASDKVRVYTNDEFDVENISLVYYRRPKDVQFLGCVNPSTGSIYTADVVCELKEDICEILVDDAASILAGDLENINQYQRNLQNSIKNS
jgi:hypothetical protein